MIIASKGHVRMKGCCIDVISEFASIAAVLFEDADITPDILKAAIDLVYLEKKDGDKE